MVALLPVCVGALPDQAYLQPIYGARRDTLRSYLNDHGIGSEVYYPLSLHLQQCYAFLGYRPGDFPVSEKLTAESLALPIHSELREHDIQDVCQTMKDFYVQDARPDLTGPGF